MNSILVGTFFVLGILYWMGLDHTRKGVSGEGVSILRAISWMWFVLLINEIISMYHTMNSIMLRQECAFEMDIVLTVVAKLILLPVALLFLWATIKRNIPKGLV
jgi:hypothetical protein